MAEEQRPAHSTFAPSASHRWLACPASLVHSKDLPEQETSVYAHEGIVCHDISATCLKEGKSPNEFLGKIVDDVDITQELVDAIQMYIDEVKGIIKEVGGKGGRIEFEVDITEDCWGTIDALSWTDDVAVVIDAKYGKGVIVSAEDNPQLKLYGIGALKFLQRELKLAPKKVLLVIIQPRTVNPIRRWEIDRTELIQWFQDSVQPAMEKAKNGETKCNPGEAQCRWCPISSTCPAQKDAVMADVEASFEQFGRAEALNFPPEGNQGGMTAKDIAELLPKLDQIQNWVNKVKTYALDMALSGGSIPGYKLVEGRSNRKWGADEKQVVDFLKANKVEPYKKSLITAPQAEKAMGKATAEKSGLDKLIVKPPGKPTLVPISDTRPGIKESIEEEFQEFTINDSKEVMVVDSTPEDDDKVSLWDRLMNGGDEDDITPEDIAETNFPAVQEVESQTATSGNQAEPQIVMMPAKTQTAPKVGTQRAEVLNFGRGGVSIKQVMDALQISENQVRMHLRYLNERDGYGVTVYKDGTYKVEQ